MNTKDLARQILDEIENMQNRLPIKDFAPADEVQKWLDATDNVGDANEISEEIYNLLDDYL